MNSYQIMHLDTQEYAVIATSYLNPFDDIGEIAQKLTDMQFEGKVLFDLLLCNGISPNRYIEMIFSGDKFLSQSFSILNDISDPFKKKIGDFLMHNPTLLEGSVLPSAQRYLLKNGKLV